MSKTPTYIPANTWDDRWNQPSPEVLLADIKETHLNVLPVLQEELAHWSSKGLQANLAWSGDAWRWSFVYSIKKPCQLCKTPDNVIAYLVPNPEAPQLVMPVEDEFISSLPFKRLNRYVREGIKSGKMSVGTIWLSWTPGPGPEMEHLCDLLRRRMKYLFGKK